MVALKWDQEGERHYETGVDRGVLFPMGPTGYEVGVPWNGLTNISENPSGAEPTPLYADNIKYLNLISAEEFAATVEAYTYPDEFAECDGTAELVPGVYIGQQDRKKFGLSYRTLVGNDSLGTQYGEKIHLIYGCQAAPSSKAYATVNDSPDAVTFSWEVTTTAIEVGSEDFKPTATVVIDSRKVSAQAFAALKAVLYGSEAEEPRMPTPAEVGALVGTPVGP